MVYDALGDLMKSDIHALSLVALAPSADDETHRDKTKGIEGQR